MKLLLCSDHRMLREGLRAFLENRGFHVVAEAADARAALELARRFLPEIIVMSLPGTSFDGLETTRQLSRELPGVRLIGLSSHVDRQHEEAMFDAGATGHLAKGAGLDELLLALHTVASGVEYRSPSAGTTAAACTAYASTRIAEAPQQKPLSPREREVLQLIAVGKSNKEIASCLGIGGATAETHRRQIMDKLGLRTVAELTKYALRVGLTSLD